MIVLIGSCINCHTPEQELPLGATELEDEIICSNCGNLGTKSEIIAATRQKKLNRIHEFLSEHQFRFRDQLHEATVADLLLQLFED